MTSQERCNISDTMKSNENLHTIDLKIRAFVNGLDPADPTLPFNWLVTSFSKALIDRAKRQSKYNTTQTAKMLMLNRTTLVEKVKKLYG